MSSLAALQDQWRYLYQEYLPALAAARDSTQKNWPVHLDHCFARIVLDHAVGVGKSWTEVVRKPAIQNLTVAQLEAAIALAQKIATGQADLVILNEESLRMRGKTAKKRMREADSLAESGTKRLKKGDATVSSYFQPNPSSPQQSSQSDPVTSGVNRVDMAPYLKQITDSDITAFRKQALTLLCQIPCGRYSTYGAMSDWISKNSHKTCARAVGSAMKNNPFAPGVPCHRVLAGDGSLGGFKGSWGEAGKYAKLKHELLREEGVKFDSTGKAKGPPFRDFSLG